MSNEAKSTLHIDAIYPERGEIMLSGRMYTLGEKIQLQYYKVGYWEECTIRDGVVTFMRKVNAPATPLPAEGQSSVTGFQTADKISPPSSRQPQRDSTPSMVWCNASNVALEILKVRMECVPTSDIVETDLVKMVLEDAAKLFKAGMEHVKAEQHG